MAGAWLFTVLSQQFVFVWSHVTEHRSFIMDLCHFHLSLSLIFSPCPLTVSVQLCLFSVLSNTDVFKKHTAEEI